MGARVNFVDNTFAGRTFKVLDRYPIPQMSAEHEPPMAKYWPLIQPGEVVVDVGACYGQYTLPAIAMGGSVVAYEPFHTGADALDAQLVENGWESRCILRRKALGNGSPYPPELLNEVWVDHYPTDRTEIVFTTLDEDLMTDVDWIKCDNEGGELLFLQGAAKTLERCKPFLIIEDHDSCDLTGQSQVSKWPASIDSSKRIHAMLSSMGYELSRMAWGDSRGFIIGNHPDNPR